MGILFDTTTGFWTLKTKDENGKDKRYKLRRIKDGENRRPIPDDVLVQASVLEGKPSDKNGVPTLNATLTTLTTTETTPLGWWLDKYLVRYSRDRRASSVNRMVFLLGLLRRFATENKLTTLNAFTKEAIEDYVDWRYKYRDKHKNKQISRTTMASELGILSGVFSTAVRVDRLTKNPLSLVLKEVRAGMVKTNKIKYLDPDQVTKFLKNLDDAEKSNRLPSDYCDLARIMLYSGLRVSAAMAMEYEWITPDYMVRVPSPCDKAKSGYDAVVVGPGRDVIDRRREASGGTGRVFPGINHRSTVRFHLTKLGIHSHQLRHSFATAAVDSGIPLQLIGGLLGHHNLKTTQIYAQIRDTTKLAMANTITFGKPSQN